MKFKAAILPAVLFATGVLGSLNIARPAASGNNSSKPGTPENPRVVQITAHRFEFVPNQITIKKGETVKIELTSTDVKHGFYIRGMKVDELIEPGKTTEVVLTPQTAGAFPTICDHLCGLGHNKMKMTVVVEE